MAYSLDIRDDELLTLVEKNGGTITWTQVKDAFGLSTKPTTMRLARSVDRGELVRTATCEYEFPGQAERPPKHPTLRPEAVANQEAYQILVAEKKAAWEAWWKPRFLDHYAATNNVAEAREAVTVSLAEFRAAVGSDPAFAEAVDDTRIGIWTRLEARLIELGLEGSVEAIKFILQHNVPQVYGKELTRRQVERVFHEMREASTDELLADYRLDKPLLGLAAGDSEAEGES